MNVNAIANPPQLPVQTSFAKSKQDLQSLQSALNSGDLAGARKDFADFQSDLANLGITSSSTPKGIQQAGGDIKALQTDLNSGDLTAAQKDMSTLLQDLQGAGGWHKHRHHHQECNNPDKTAPGASRTDPASSGTSSSGTPANGFNFRAMIAAYNAFVNTDATGTSLNATA
jgi:hypothetical protein